MAALDAEEVELDRVGSGAEPDLEPPAENASTTTALSSTCRHRYCGSSSTPVPTRRRVVTAANAASAGN